MFLFAFWIPPTTAQLALDSVNAVEGQDVTLRARNVPYGVAGFLWYRGPEIKFSNLIGVIAWQISRQVVGPQYTGREIARLDGSLTIRKVTSRDIGIYFVVAILIKSRHTAFGRLNVYCECQVG